MSEQKSIGGFFTDWFKALDQGLDSLDVRECSCLFAGCAKRCSEDVVKYLYKGIFDECGGDLDQFFARLHEIDNVDGKVIEPGKVYELIFRKCECPVHTDAGIKSAHLCACSKQSMTCVFQALLPDRPFIIEQLSTILGGSEICRHRITFDK